MPNDSQFGLFKDDEKGPIWRASFADLAEAKLHAQKFAESEGAEFFVFCFKTFTQVTRLLPSKHKSQLKSNQVPTQRSESDK